MHKVPMAVALAAAAVYTLFGTPAEAGLDKLHKQHAEGGRVCFVSHWHYKSSGAWATKDQAVAAVSRSWSRFTGAEYGARWANLGVAAGKQLNCAQSTGSRGAFWTCDLKARPCRT